MESYPISPLGTTRRRVRFQNAGKRSHISGKKALLEAAIASKYHVAD
jgi:hypothetical protein